jgi:hypothetical protein
MGEGPTCAARPRRARVGAVSAAGEGVESEGRAPEAATEEALAFEEATRELLGEPAGDLRFIGDVVIRGRATATALWGLEQA